MANPFKFGSIVDKDYFTDRTSETAKVQEILSSGNHLVIISPRRFGKTSLILNSTKNLNRPVIYLDLLSVTDIVDFANQLLRRVLAVSKWESVKHLIAGFRIVPKVELNPITGGMDVAFTPSVSTNYTQLEDVLALIEKMSKPKSRPIVILDEFQQITAFSKALPGQLRAVMQHHTGVNYVLLGSEESMMRAIFQSKKSPFYHFGYLMTLSTISDADFKEYLTSRLSRVTDNFELVSDHILSFTQGHPYNTQQLAYFCYSHLSKSKYNNEMFEDVISEIIDLHDKDFEQLWNTIRNTDKRILIALASGKQISSIDQPTSTLYSGLKRLQKQGYLIKTDTYVFDDPFFRQWILRMRENAID